MYAIEKRKGGVCPIQAVSWFRTIGLQHCILGVGCLGNGSLTRTSVVFGGWVALEMLNSLGLVSNATKTWTLGITRCCCQMLPPKKNHHSRFITLIHHPLLSFNINHH